MRTQPAGLRRSGGEEKRRRKEGADEEARRVCGVPGSAPHRATAHSPSLPPDLSQLNQSQSDGDRSMPGNVSGH